MLLGRLLVAMSLGCFLIGSNAEAICPKGFQPWKMSRGEVCLPDPMVAYLACLESSGGGRITVEQNDASSSSKKVNVSLEGGGGNLVARGKGKIAVNTENGNAAINQIKQQFDPKNNTNCFKGAFRAPATAPQRPPKQAPKAQSLQPGPSVSERITIPHRGTLEVKVIDSAGVPQELSKIYVSARKDSAEKWVGTCSPGLTSKTFDIKDAKILSVNASICATEDRWILDKWGADRGDPFRQEQYSIVVNGVRIGPTNEVEQSKDSANFVVNLRRE